jgi:hypothetical protein
MNPGDQKGLLLGEEGVSNGFKCSKQVVNDD